MNWDRPKSCSGMGGRGMTIVTSGTHGISTWIDLKDLFKQWRMVCSFIECNSHYCLCNKWDQMHNIVYKRCSLSQYLNFFIDQGLLLWLLHLIACALEKQREIALGWIMTIRKGQIRLIKCLTFTLVDCHIRRQSDGRLTCFQSEADVAITVGLASPLLSLFPFPRPPPFPFLSLFFPLPYSCYCTLLLRFAPSLPFPFPLLYIHSFSLIQSYICPLPPPYTPLSPLPPSPLLSFILFFSHCVPSPSLSLYPSPSPF